MNIMQTVNEIIHNQNVTLIPYKDEFWTHNSEEIIELFHKYNFKNVVEVGCWTGHTTECLAKLIPEDGRVIAVDPWTVCPYYISVFTQPMLDQAFLQFLSNMHHIGSGEKVFVVKKTSVEAADDIIELMRK